MSKQAKTTEEDNMNMEDPKLAAIKEIIFGENIKEYDQEFRSLHALVDEQRKDFQKKMDVLKKDLNELIAETKSDFSKQIGVLKDEAFNRLSQLGQEKEQDKQALGDMLIEVGKRLKSE